jgi:hypothetical protein
MTTTSAARFETNKIHGEHCGYCCKTISRGANCYRYADGQVRCVRCVNVDVEPVVAVADPVQAAPVATPVDPAYVAYLIAHFSDHAIGAPEPLSDWEREYEDE